MKQLLLITVYLLINIHTFSQEFVYIHDSANLLSTEQQYFYEQQSKKIASENGVTIFFITVSELNENVVEWLQQYYQNNADAAINTIIFFVNMDPQKRWLEVRSYGHIQQLVTTKRIQSIREVITPYMSSQEYNNAVQIYYEQIAMFLSGDIPEESSRSSFRLIITLLIAVIIGRFLTKLLLKRSGGVMTVSHSNYNQNSKISNRYDHFLYSHTTKRDIDDSKSSNSKSSSSSGGGNSF